MRRVSRKEVNKDESELFDFIARNQPRDASTRVSVSRFVFLFNATATVPLNNPCKN